MINSHDLNPVYWPLRLTYGLAPLLAGLDKFTNILADWQSYLSPAIREVLPFGPGVFMAAVGVIEAVVGLAILTRFTRLGACVASAWLLLIAANLLVAGVLDVAVRDVVMSVGAYSLAVIAGLRGEALIPGSSRSPARGAHMHAA